MESNYQIYFEEDTEITEFEYSSKGYRSDIYVEIGNNVFHVNMYTLTRLKQDFENEVESYGCYQMDPNLIIVDDITTKKIIKAINYQYKQKYFDHLKPVENVDLSKMVQIQ